MNIQVIHPTDSFKAIQDGIDAGETIWRSPHVGNVNATELSLMLGVATLGGSMQIELVDTIRGDDKYSDPRNITTSSSTMALASRQYAKSRIVGACEISPERQQAIETFGFGNLLPGDGMVKTLHLNSLRAVLPEAVRVRPSSELYASLGECAYRLVLEASAEIVNRPIRNVDNDGKFREADMTADNSLYGLGEDRNVGLLPPLEAMIAIEFISAATKSGGSDSQIMHIAGPDMIRYTKDAAIMEPSIEIARRVVSALGIGQTTSIDYVIPCIQSTITDEDFPVLLSSDVTSQYDILLSNDREKGAA